MKVTRDVVTDLWPVYESGAASADTRAMVEEFLKQDPEFARLIREERSREMLNPMEVTLGPDHEKAALSKTKKLLRLRTQLMAAAITLTCAAVIVRIPGLPYFNVAALPFAVAGWVGLWMTHRRLAVKGW